jgi:glycopeptide antibiotics resistance protein
VPFVVNAFFSRESSIIGVWIADYLSRNQQSEISNTIILMDVIVDVNESLILAIVVALWIGYRVLRWITVGKDSRAREALIELFFLFALGVVIVAIFPMSIALKSWDYFSSNLIPLVVIVGNIRNPETIPHVAGNLLMLAPLGVFIPLLVPKVRTAGRLVGIGFLISLLVESSQLLLRIRQFDVDDIIMNTLGVELGFVVYRVLAQNTRVARFFETFSRPVRPRRWLAFTIFALCAVLAFLGVLVTQVAHQTVTEQTVIDGLAAEQRSLVGEAHFDEFLVVFSQTGDGRKWVEIYRRVLLGRYTPFETNADIRLVEDSFTVSQMVTGLGKHYFVIARSAQPVAALASGEKRFPATRFGEYFIAYTWTWPWRSNLRGTFYFVDAAGNHLDLQMYGPPEAQ